MGSCMHCKYNNGLIYSNIPVSSSLCPLVYMYNYVHKCNMSEGLWFLYTRPTLTVMSNKLAFLSMSKWYSFE